MNEVSRYLQEGWRLVTVREQGVKVSDDEYAEKRGLHRHYVKRFREILEKGRKNDLVKRLPELKEWHEVKVTLTLMTISLLRLFTTHTHSKMSGTSNI